jgi:hypothetical protein
MTVSSEGDARIGGGIEDPLIARALASKAYTVEIQKARKDKRLRK